MHTFLLILGLLAPDTVAQSQPRKPGTTARPTPPQSLSVPSRVDTIGRRRQDRRTLPDSVRRSGMSRIDTVRGKRR